MITVQYSNFVKLALIVSIFSFISGCGQNSIKGEGAATQERRDVKSFSGIEIDGDYAVLGTIGKQEQLVISTNPNILPYIKSTISNDILTIKSDDSVKLQPTVKQNISFATQELNSVLLSGNMQFQMNSLNSKNLECTFNGSNKAALQGRATKLKIIINGSANINTNSLEVHDAEIEINGSGTVAVNVSDNLKVKINGDGKVVYSNGKPKIEQSITGSGKVVSAFGVLEQQH